MKLNTYRFNVGKFECIAINDGTYSYSAKQYFHNAAPEELGAALHDHHLDPTRVPSPYTCLVINTGTHRVLVDTGAGDFTPDVGRLLPTLLAKGIAPEEIDTVIITHGHPDHLGGNTDAMGIPVFRNARHVLWRDEWEYWTDEANLARLAPVFGRFARKNLQPLAEQLVLLELLDREVEIVPGIYGLPAPGHTPGQMALVVSSGNDELLYISDAACHPLHLERPDWHTVWDLDPGQALATRRRLLDRAAADKALVLAFHFDPFPGLGHAVSHGQGWRWEPVDAHRHSIAADSSSSDDELSEATSR